MLEQYRHKCTRARFAKDTLRGYARCVTQDSRSRRSAVRSRLLKCQSRGPNSGAPGMTDDIFGKWKRGKNSICWLFMNIQNRVVPMQPKRFLFPRFKNILIFTKENANAITARQKKINFTYRLPYFKSLLWTCLKANWRVFN